MYRSFGIFGLSAALFVAAASCSRMQSFELSGRIDGLKVGDTLRFERVLLPEWNYEPAFDVVVGEAGAFAYRGEQAHDGYYSMTYHPKSGRAADADRRGKSMIVTGGDRITLTGTAEAIYYCTLGGGIYDDPALSELLYVADSLGRIRSGYSENARAAFARGDQAEGRRWNELFNRFYADDPGAARKRALNENYRKGHPQGTLYLLVDRIPTVAYRPLAESRAFYEALSEELKSSYFGGVYADFLQRMESLAVGQPAPDFSLVTTRGETIAKADFAGGYVLFYHWGMCPGSIRIDGQVRDLYAAYKDRGLRMVGLTESVDMIRRVYEGLPDDESAAGMRSALAGIRADVGAVCDRGVACLRAHRTRRDDRGPRIYGGVFQGEGAIGKRSGWGGLRVIRGCSHLSDDSILNGSARREVCGGPDFVFRSRRLTAVS